MLEKLAKKLFLRDYDGVLFTWEKAANWLKAEYVKDAINLLKEDN